MCKRLLLKIVGLVILLAVVLSVIVVGMRVDLRWAAARPAQTRTLFEQFVIAGGPIVWFVLLPISFITVYLAAWHFLTIRRKKLLPPAIARKIVEIVRQFGIRQLEARIAEQDDFVSVAIVKSVSQGRADWFRMRSLVAESLQDQASQQLRKIEWLNLIGNVSPMVGLFGTVFGMIKLFNAIVTAGGQPQPAQLAEGISVALVTTFWGLAIAIPALAMHGVFRNRIETLISDAVAETENIMPQIRLSLKKQTESHPTEKRKQPIRELDSEPAQAVRKPGRNKLTIDY